MAYNVACKVDNRHTYSILRGKSAENKPLGRPKLRGEDKVKRGVKKESGRGKTGVMWLRNGTSDGLL